MIYEKRPSFEFIVCAASDAFCIDLKVRDYYYFGLP